MRQRYAPYHDVSQLIGRARLSMKDWHIFAGTDCVEEIGEVFEDMSLGAENEKRSLPP